MKSIEGRKLLTKKKVALSWQYCIRFFRSSVYSFNLPPGWIWHKIILMWGAMHECRLMCSHHKICFFRCSDLEVGTNDNHWYVRYHFFIVIEGGVRWKVWLIEETLILCKRVSLTKKEYRWYLSSWSDKT